MKKIVVIIAVIVLLQMVFVPATFAAPPPWDGWNQCGNTCYTVRYGDTLFSIGRRFGVNPYYIAQVNGLRNPNFIYAGQVLHIPAGNCCWGQPGRPQPWPGHHSGGWDYSGYYPGSGYGGYQQPSYGGHGDHSYGASY